jgi:hypothetical protein
MLPMAGNGQSRPILDSRERQQCRLRDIEFVCGPLLLLGFLSARHASFPHEYKRHANHHAKDAKAHGSPYA